MAGSTVELIIKAVDNASGTLKKVAGESGSLGGSMGKLNDMFKNATGISLGAVGGYALLGTAIAKVGQFIGQSVQETQAYNLAMVDMARMMGTTTEEASRLVQVADDVRISQEALGTAMKIASKNGVEPTIESMAQLADQYLALAPGVERNQFLLTTFGRSGLEMGKLLEQGGAGVRSMSAAIDSSLIVTKEAGKQAKLYYESIDRLNDAWTAFKINVGNGVIPVLTDVLIKNQAAAKTLDQLGAAASRAGTGFSNEYIALLKVNEEILNGTYDAVEETGFLKNAIQAAGEEATQQEEAFSGLSSALGSYSNALLYSMAAQNMDTDSALALGVSLGVVDAKALKAKQVMDELDKKLDSGQISASQYKDAVLGLGSGIDGLENKSVDVIVNILVRGTLPASIGGFQINPETNASPVATGLDDFVVPPGYPNDTYPLRVESGERVTVEPAYDTRNKRRGSGQGGHTFYGNVNFSVTNERSMSEIMDSLSRL